jgi:diketogulonate reductase-like aldo/keto reductase
MQYYTLNTQQKVPVIGFGTWEITPDKEAKAAVAAALEAGYRIIDTARIYGNEKGVGEAIRESGLPREDIVVTTKLWNDDQGYDSTLKAFDKSLERLGLDYVDLYLIHWPATRKRHESWNAMEKLFKDGSVKAAGVCNYTVEHLEELMSRSSLVPAVNQVEFHPFIYAQQLDLLDFCETEGIMLEAYSPLSRISSEGNKAISDIATRYSKSPQQLVLRWCIAHGTLPLPRSTNPDHIESNFDVFDFKINENDLRTLDSLSDGGRVTWDPAGMGQ